MTTFDPRTAGRIHVGVVVKSRRGVKFLDPRNIFHPRVVRMGAEWELLVPHEIYERAGPYLDRLRRHTASRRQYRLLRAILVENALVTGQSSETEIVLRIVERLWKKCPRRYLTWW
jgi:hypothetical protein